MRNKGFTLVEMLIVISILSVVGVMILTVFTRTLKGSNKSQIIGVIKQNGQSVLENIDMIVRDSDYVVCPTITSPAISASASSLAVVKNGIYTRYSFIPPASSANGNGLLQQDNPVKQNVSGVTPAREETDTEFRDRICSSTDTPSVNVVTLTDNKSDTGVSVSCIVSNCGTNPIFTRNKSSGFKDQITIKFSLKPAASQGVAGQIDPVSFQTTIQLR